MTSHRGGWKQARGLLAAVSTVALLSAAIAGAIASVLDDDDLAGRLRAAGRARAEATTWAATAAATIAAYEEVIAR